MEFHYKLERDDTVTIKNYLGMEEKPYIPKEINGYAIAQIDCKAFAGNNCIKEIVIPEGVTYIGDYAFSACSNLACIHIPSSVAYIASTAFANCGRVVTKKQWVSDYESSDPWTRRNAGAYGPAEYCIEVKEYQMTAVVTCGSYAEGYCKAHNIRYTVK